MPIIVDDPTGGSATLALRHLWLNAVADPADAIALRVRSFSPRKTVKGEARELANRIRWISTGLTVRSLDATLVRPTAEQRRWLADHVGQLVTVRDPDGGKFAGVYADLGYDRPVEGADLSLSVGEVTSSEAV